MDLHQAAEYGDTKRVTELLDSGAHIGALDASGMTALHRAATAGHADVVAVLLARGADANARTGIGLTPLHASAMWSKVDAARLLLAAGADLHATIRRRPGRATVGSTQGWTPLHFAAEWRFEPFHDQEEMVKLLLNAGADPNAKAKNGMTPLWMPREVGRTEIVQILEDHGAVEDWRV